MKVQITELKNGDIELRSTDFEALQEEKKWYLSDDYKKKNYHKKGMTCLEELRGKCGEYKVKESWSVPHKYFSEKYEGGEFSGKLLRCEHVIILEKL